ncbi:hypothetical protein N7513_003263 [Penicillium frequentans]|nr:hypothetical protein N7513_003263 [Penicillium glabrum]
MAWPLRWSALRETWENTGDSAFGFFIISLMLSSLESLMASLHTAQVARHTLSKPIIPAPHKLASAW